MEYFKLVTYCFKTNRTIVKNNDIVWEKQLGYANIMNNILVDENTMFILSSISKTITATALLQLSFQLQ